MADMIVALRDIADNTQLYKSLQDSGIFIQRAIAPDKLRVVKWVQENGGNYAAGEVDVSMSKTPATCFLAVCNKQILGYACYNAIAPDFFGPTMVLESERGKSIGKALLMKCLEALSSEGYVYAIIGGIGPAEFYIKCVGAHMIPNSTPGIYKNFLLGND